MRTIFLGGEKAAGRVAIVDDEDHELVAEYSWHVHESVRGSGRMAGPYAKTNVRIEGRPTSLLMHNLIMGVVGVDHINHDGLDNRRSNLRLASQLENLRNIGPLPGSSSRFKGVYWDSQTRRWRSEIKVNGRKRHIGRFDSEEEAARAYDAASLAVSPEFAYLNFPLAAS